MDGQSCLASDSGNSAVVLGRGWEKFEATAISNGSSLSVEAERIFPSRYLPQEVAGSCLGRERPLF